MVARVRDHCISYFQAKKVFRTHQLLSESFTWLLGWFYFLLISCFGSDYYLSKVGKLLILLKMSKRLNYCLYFLHVKSLLVLLSQQSLHSLPWWMFIFIVFILMPFMLLPDSSSSFFSAFPEQESYAYCVSASSGFFFAWRGSIPALPFSGLQSSVNN